jgi:chromosome segregation ATPase
MAKIVGIGVLLFILAVGFIVVTQSQDIVALFEAYRAEPLALKLAWFVAVLIPLALIPAAGWLLETLVRQRQAAGALELRLGGVRQSAREAVKSQVGLEASVHHLARTDPEDAIGAVTERLTEAERLAAVQESRNEIGDLQARVDELRAKQDILRRRLVPVLEKRRTIERLFAELDSRESDLDHALTEVASGDDATAIEARLAELKDFVGRGHERGDEIENAAKSLAGLKQDYHDLRMRLAPFTTAKDGVTRRVKDLSEARDRLAAEIEALQQTPQGSLAARVAAFADDKSRLDDGLANLEREFSKLAALRQDVEGLSRSVVRAFDLLSIPGADAEDANARIATVSEFIKATQTRFDGVERTMASFGELKDRLGEFQTRLGPLESRVGGIADLIAQVQGLRDRLIAKIKLLEADENGDLAARVDTFIDAKRELEQRVATVTEQFSKLATIRSDIAVLFDKLSNAAETN